MNAGAVAVVGLIAASCSSSRSTTDAHSVSNGVLDPNLQIEMQSASKPTRTSKSIADSSDRTPSAEKDVLACAADACVGSLPERAISQIRDRAAKTQDCFETALKQSQDLQGRLVMALRLAPSGHLCRAQIINSELGKRPEFESCLVETMNIAYSAPTNGCVDLNLPLNFVRKEVETSTDAGSSAAGSRDQ